MNLFLSEKEIGAFFSGCSCKNNTLRNSKNFVHWCPVDVASLCQYVPNGVLFCPLLLTGLDRGECSEADLQKAKGMVPKSLENYVVRKCI
jgi:hypothetical protein